MMTVWEIRGKISVVICLLSVCSFILFLFVTFVVRFILLSKYQAVRLGGKTSLN